VAENRNFIFEKVKLGKFSTESDGRPWNKVLCIGN